MSIGPVKSVVENHLLNKSFGKNSQNLFENTFDSESEWIIKSLFFKNFYLKQDFTSNLKGKLSDTYSVIEFDEIKDDCGENDSKKVSSITDHSNRSSTITSDCVDIEPPFKL